MHIRFIAMVHKHTRPIYKISGSDLICSVSFGDNTDLPVIDLFLYLVTKLALIFFTEGVGCHTSFFF